MAPYIDSPADDEASGTSRGPLPNINISIDRGGTFCDVIAEVDGQEPIIFKLLSEDPKNYPDAPTEAIRRVLNTVQGQAIPIGEKLDGSRIGRFSLHRSHGFHASASVP